LGRGSNWQITPNAMVARRDSARRRQVDVFASCPSGPATFRVGIDVKDERAPVDIETMEQLCAKGLGLELDRYVVMSTSGFTKAALDEAKSKGVQAARLRKNDLKSVFALDHVDVSTPTIHAVALLMAEPFADPPKLEPATAWMEEELFSIRLDAIPGPYLDRLLREHRDWADGQMRDFQIVDEARTWKRLVLAGTAWDPPRALKVQWSATVVRYFGQKLATENGSEAFSIVLPVDGAMKQLTLVGAPAKGGFGFSVALGDPTPPRTRV
jgi:Restriction endonuclease